jgi:hypothetical protein
MMSTSLLFLPMESASPLQPGQLPTISQQGDRFPIQTTLSSLSLPFAHILYPSDRSSFPTQLSYEWAYRMMPERPRGPVSTGARGESSMSYEYRSPINGNRIELNPGDYVTVSASRYPFAYVLPQDGRGEDWVHSISKTLNWNSREKQKGCK